MLIYTKKPPKTLSHACRPPSGGGGNTTAGVAVSFSNGTESRGSLMEGVLVANSSPVSFFSGSDWDAMFFY